MPIKELSPTLPPGDVSFMIGGETATAEDIRAIRKELGLDRNIAVRYFEWLGQVMRGDLGTSYLSGEPVFDAILARLPVTLELLVIAQFLALLLALPAGMLSAHRNNSIVDRIISTGGGARSFGERWVACVRAMKPRL